MPTGAGRFGVFYFFRGGREVRVCAQVLPNLIRVRAVNGYTARVRAGGASLAFTPGKWLCPPEPGGRGSPFISKQSASI